MTEAGGAEAAAIHSALVARAAAGDPNVLDQARAASDERLYEEVLRELSAHAAQKSPDKLRALALHIAHGRGLRADVNLVRRFAALWRQSPNQEDAATLLRLAALSNDADAFLSVANEIVNRWQRGQLPQLSAPVLQSLIESDFWLLSSEARRSGGGYLLKRRLLSLRGELAKAGSSASSDNSAVLGD